MWSLEDNNGTYRIVNEDRSVIYDEGETIEFGGGTMMVKSDYIPVKDEATRVYKGTAKDWNMMIVSILNGMHAKDGKDGETGPKGDKGDTGETGPKGDKGDKGDTGSLENIDSVDLSNNITVKADKELIDTNTSAIALKQDKWEDLGFFMVDKDTKLITIPIPTNKKEYIHLITCRDTTSLTTIQLILNDDPYVNFGMIIDNKYQWTLESDGTIKYSGISSSVSAFISRRKVNINGD